MAGKRSVVCNFFEVFNEVGKPRAHCKMCNNLSLAYSGGTGNLLHHLQMKHPTRLDRNKGKSKLLSVRLNSSERSIEITKPISLFVVLDLRPISVVDGIGFKKLLNYIEPGYRVPSRPHCLFF